MPYKSEKIPIAGTVLDKRRKLSPELKEAVKLLYEQGYSQRRLAEIFGCSRRLIQHIIKPQRPSAPRPRPKEYWTERKRLYRQRKQKLFVEGRLQQKLKKK